MTTPSKTSSKRGAALMQAIMISAIMISLSMAVVRWSMSMKISTKKMENSFSARAELEMQRARIWGCLAERGYPPFGGCNTNSDQLKCIPSEVTAVFGGSYPHCTIDLTISRFQDFSGEVGGGGGGGGGDGGGHTADNYLQN